MSDSPQISILDDAAQDPGQARSGAPLQDNGSDQDWDVPHPTTVDHEPEILTPKKEPELKPEGAPRSNAPDREQPNNFDRKSPLSKPDEQARLGAPSHDRPHPNMPTEREQGEQKKAKGIPPVLEASPEHADFVTVEEAVAIFRERGLPRHIRTIQKYCARKQGRALTCYPVPTENGIRYMLEKGSIDRFISDATEQAPTGAIGHDPASEPRSETKRERPATQSGLDVFEHPYVKRLEDQVEKLEVKNDRLQSTVQNVLEQANERLIELQKANAVAQSETLGTFLLEAERIRNTKEREVPDHPESVVQEPDVQERTYNV